MAPDTRSASRAVGVVLALLGGALATSCSILREKLAGGDAGADGGAVVTAEPQADASGGAVAPGTEVTTESPSAEPTPTARPGRGPAAKPVDAGPRIDPGRPTDAGAAADAGARADAGGPSDAGAKVDAAPAPKRPATGAAVVMASYDRTALYADLPRIEASKPAVLACANKTPGVFAAGDQISVRVAYPGGKPSWILGWSRHDSSTPVPADVQPCLDAVVASIHLQARKVPDAGTTRGGAVLLQPRVAGGARGSRRTSSALDRRRGGGSRRCRSDWPAPRGRISSLACGRPRRCRSRRRSTRSPNGTARPPRTAADRPRGADPRCDRRADAGAPDRRDRTCAGEAILKARRRARSS